MASAMFHESVQVLLHILQCNRRSPQAKAGARDSTNKKVQRNVGKVTSVWTGKSAGEFADLSTDYHSDTATEGCSTTEFSDDMHRGRRDRGRVVGDRVGGPPGLVAPPWQANRAAPRNMTPARGPNGMHQGPSGESEGLAALKDALDKLAPSEIATVKSLLDSKMGPPGLNAPWSGGAGYGHASRTPQVPVRRREGHTAGRYGGACGEEGHTAAELHQGTGDTLRTFLASLANTDSARVLTVRRINRLGLDSKALLKPYFEKFGEVDQVMVSHTTPKSINGSTHSGQTHGDERRRVRPAVLGFVVMCKAEDAKAAMEYDGGNHIISGVTITAGPFQSHSVEEEPTKP